MAKDAEKQVAYNLYVNECLTAKEISNKIGVSEKSIGIWVEKGNWKALKLSKQTSNESLIGKYQDLLHTLLDKRLASEKTRNKTQKQEEEYRSLIDEMSKIAAMIDRIQKDGRSSLRVHIMVLEKFMAALHQNNPKLFMQLIDFQKEYLMLLAEELK